MDGKLPNIDVNIKTAVAKTLENMVFSPVDDNPLVWTRMETLTPFKLEFFLLLPEKTALSLATNLAGGDGEEIPEPAILDCAAEMLNTIAGQFLEEALPPDIEFSFGLPKAGISSSFEFPTSTKIFLLQLEGDTFAVGISDHTGELI